MLTLSGKVITNRSNMWYRIALGLITLKETKDASLARLPIWS